MFTLSTSHAFSYHHGDLRDALIGHALELLEAGGSAQLSLRELARRAGVSATACYRHFADKDQLLAAVAARGFDRLAEVLREADARPEPMVAQGLAYVRFGRGHPALFRLMFSAPLNKPDDDLARSGLAAQTVLRARVRDEAEMLAAWGLVHGLAMLQIDGRLPGLEDQQIEEILRSVKGEADPPLCSP